MANRSEILPDSTEKLESGFFGTFRRVGRTLKRRLRRKTKSKEKKQDTDPEKTCSKEAKLNIEQLPSRIQELLQTRESVRQMLDELIDVNRGIATDVRKMDIELYCMNSMDDHRYSFLKDYLPNARKSLCETEDAYRRMKDQTAQRLGCTVKTLEKLLHPGGDKVSQTSGVPDDSLKILECYDQEGCRMHINMTQNHLALVREVLSNRKAEIKLEETQRQKRLELLRRKRTQLGYQVKELERKQDAAKRL